MNNIAFSASLHDFKVPQLGCLLILMGGVCKNVH